MDLQLVCPIDYDDDQDFTKCDYCNEKAYYDVTWLIIGTKPPIAGGAWCCKNCYYEKIKTKAKKIRGKINDL